MKLETTRQLAERYGDRVKNLIMFADRDTLDDLTMQKHIAMLAELANFYVRLSGGKQYSMEEGK